jgi:hypothetical protein
MNSTELLHYLPIITTIVSAIFATTVLRRWGAKGGTHLLWWGFGIVAYGAGTITESLTTLFGWHPATFKAWYITGALLGGAPLAQGTAYLHFPRRWAHLSAALLGIAIVGTALWVLATPVDSSLAESHRLSGVVFTDQSVRMVSPLLNSYAALVLIGGAIVSAARYASAAGQRHRMWANVSIALGGLLPGIGGASARFGHIEVLYITELVGLLLIYVGYRMSVRGSAPASPAFTNVAYRIS